MSGVGIIKTKVTQEDCDVARFFTKRGMKGKDIATMLKVSASTVSNIKAADFHLDQYLEMMKESKRKEAANRKKKEVREEMLEQHRKDREWIEEHSKPAEEQITGQMKMDLKTEEPAEEKPEMSDMTKMMRFQAHLADRIIKKLDEILAELRRTDA